MSDDFQKRLKQRAKAASAAPAKPTPTAQASTSNAASQDLQRAKELIQAKRYDDARALLITIDHPTATKWLERINSMVPASTSIPPSDAKPTALKKPPPTRASPLVTTLVMMVILVTLGGLVAVVKNFSDQQQRQGDELTRVLETERYSKYLSHYCEIVLNRSDDNPQCQAWADTLTPQRLEEIKACNAAHDYIMDTDGFTVCIFGFGVTLFSDTLVNADISGLKDYDITHMAVLGLYCQDREQKDFCHAWVFYMYSIHRDLVTTCSQRYQLDKNAFTNCIQVAGLRL